MNKKLILITLAITTALVLSACSVLESLIPDQEVEGFMGVEEELVLPAETIQAEEPVVPAAFAKNLPSFLKTQQTPAGFIPFGFYRGADDLTEALPVTPKKITQAVSFTNLVFTGGTETTEFPETVALELAFLNVWLWDGYVAPNQDGWIESWTNLEEVTASFAAAGELATDTTVLSAMLQFEKDASNCTGTSCNYKLNQASSESVALLLGSEKVQTAEKILSADAGDSDKNSVAVFGFFKVNTELPSGLSASVSVDAPAAIVSFRE